MLVTLEKKKKKENHQNQQDTSSGEHDYLYKVSCQSIQ